MRAALGVSDGVDLINNDGLHAAQNFAALLRGQQNVERFRRGDQNVRRPLQHVAPLMHQRVAGSDCAADDRVVCGSAGDAGDQTLPQQSALGGEIENLAQRDFQVLLDVVSERLQRRNVENLGPVLERPGQGLANEPINAGEKCR